MNTIEQGMRQSDLGEGSSGATLDPVLRMASLRWYLSWGLNDDSGKSILDKILFEEKGLRKNVKITQLVFFYLYSFI